MQMDQIGKDIAARRKQQGLSQEELARQIGVTRQAVSKWESGAALPSVDNMVELSRVLHASVDELLHLAPQTNEPALSAQSVGLLLDEQSARQEKRIRRLTIALFIAAVILGAGILLSAVMMFSGSHRMEERLNEQIASTDRTLSSAINSLNSRISATIQQAVSDGKTRLTDSGYHFAYDHENRAFTMTLQAYPQVLGEYENAEFYLVLSDGTRITADAEMTEGCFLGTISIPDAGQERISGTAYITWTENGETVTESIRLYDTWTYFYRLMITSAGMSTRSRIGEDIAVKPYAEVCFSIEANNIYPVRIRYDIYAGDELITTIEEDQPFQLARSNTDYRTHTLSDFLPLPGVTSAEGLLLRVTVTDNSGNEYTKECTPN